jgi:hypothetical protein
MPAGSMTSGFDIVSAVLDQRDVADVATALQSDDVDRSRAGGA